MNSHNFSWEKVSKLFGQPVNSSAMKSFFADSGVDTGGLREYAIGIANKDTAPPKDLAEIDLKERCGVRLSFGWGSLYVGFENLGSEFVLAGIRYYADGEDSAHGYDGSMPFGFTFSDTESAFLAKVPRPSDSQDPGTNETYGYHRWDWDTYSLHALFRSRTLLLRRVSAFLPMKGYKPVVPPKKLTRVM
jgi:hypothetical protein